MTEKDMLTIARLGHEGDGLAESPNGIVAVPGALPGDRVAVDKAGRPVLLDAANPERVVPRCRHFGTCGGCVSQHMAPRLYASWKLEGLITALVRAGISQSLDTTVTVPPGTRRRMVLSASRGADGRVHLGFHGRRAHAVVDIEECPVSAPQLTARLDTVRSMVEPIVRSDAEVRITVTTSAQGLDVALRTERKRHPLSAAVRQRIVAACAGSGVARVTLDDEPLVMLVEPLIDAPGGALSFPPGAFTQAVPEAEQAIAGCITQGLGKAKSVADLFCGIGTFTVTAAKRARTLALDSDRASIDALERSIRRISGLKPVEARARDLIGEPLSAMELRDFDAVVLDPPRAGAKAQCEALARSTVKSVVMVSCNPATFARDLAILVSGGFTIRRITPVDQFLWSSHLEVVAQLSR